MKRTLTVTGAMEYRRGELFYLSDFDTMKMFKVVKVINKVTVEIRPAYFYEKWIDRLKRAIRKWRNK